ncbi:MAG: GFA family protein [Psychrobacter sp.]|nr:GFA family protein [Psychrobacter sp.]
MVKGSCLCGNIEFSCDFGQSPIKIYQCHCTLCKKQSGSSSNSATIIPAHQFNWISSEGIKVWKKSSGFNAHFCENCGCGVPNRFADKYYWVPIGLLDLASHSENEVKLVAHLCLSTKSSWHELNEDAEKFEKLPELQQLLALLN